MKKRTVSIIVVVIMFISTAIPSFALAEGHEHIFTNYISDNNATCKADGTKTAVCDVDGCIVTDTVIDEGSQGHDYVDGICSRCGDIQILCQGQCGDNAEYVLYGTGKLIITGSGEMWKNSRRSWFSYRDNIKEVQINSGITNISQYAFYDCSNLSTVSLADSITDIGDYAFSSCDSLSGITLPKELLKIGNGVFDNCPKLKKIIIPEKTSNIGKGAFEDCINLESVYIPDSVKSLGSGMFKNCSSLITVNIPEEITEIGANFFYGCTKLANINISKNVKTIGDYAFRDCKKLTEITIPSNVESIGEDLFKNCTGLKNVTIENGLSSISYETFIGCTALEKISIPVSVTVIDGFAFSECSSLTDVYYSGLKSQWNKITVETGNDSLTLATIHFGTHQTTKVPYKAPSCTAAGNIEYYICSDCGLYFKDEDCIQEIKSADTVIKAKGHTPVTVPGKAATMTEDGLTDGSKCSTCGVTLKEQQVITKYGQVNLGLGANIEVYVDGKKYTTDSNGNIVLPDGNAKTAVIYSYKIPSSDVHTQYPTGMQVYRLSFANNKYTASRLSELDNCLQYAGASIRVSDPKGIRMITAVPESMKNALTGSGLAGYTLEEYGTLLAFSSKIGDSNPLVLGGSGVISNYAYKKGVADPVYKRENGLIKYTNPIVGFTMEQCKPDLSIRSYMKLKDSKTGEVITIYGGIIQRSIKYIAEQNKNAFKAGTKAYNYIWSIING